MPRHRQWRRLLRANELGCNRGNLRRTNCVPPNNVNVQADINFRGFFGGTGLHWAAINGHRETVEFLLASGADMTLKDEQIQSTPREWALEQQRGDIAQLLVPDSTVNH